MAYSLSSAVRSWLLTQLRRLNMTKAITIFADGFDAVDELYAGDRLWQLVVAVETAPAFLSGLCELEYHGDRRPV